MAVARELNVLAGSADEAVGAVELVSVDSMQVYRGMNIGTAKPSAAEQAEVRHHCIDLVSASSEFTVANFKVAQAAALADIASRDGRAILVGGSGLYHRVAIDDFDLPGEWPKIRAELSREVDTEVLYARLASLDPEAATKMEPENRRRVIRALEVTVGSGRKFSTFGPGVDHYPDSGVVQIGIRRPRPVVAALVEERVHRMVAAGLFDEVQTLSDAGMSKTAAQALGYKETVEYLQGRIGNDEAVEMIITRTRQFAVRQERWFRRDPRVRWIDVEDDPVTEVAPVVAAELNLTQ
jgi:tRNA dimethylallyltransferase